MCALCIVCPCFFSPFAIRSSFSSDLDLFIEATHSHSQYSQSFLWLLLWAVLLFPSCTNAHAFTRLTLLIVFAHWLISLKTFHFPLYVHAGSICWCNSSKWFSCRMRFYRIQQCLFPARLACQRIKALNAFDQWKHCVRTNPNSISTSRHFLAFFINIINRTEPNRSGFVEKIPQWNMLCNHTIGIVLDV